MENIQVNSGQPIVLQSPSSDYSNWATYNSTISETNSALRGLKLTDVSEQSPSFQFETELLTNLKPIYLNKDNIWDESITTGNIARKLRILALTNYDLRLENVQKNEERSVETYRRDTALVAESNKISPTSTWPFRYMTTPGLQNAQLAQRFLTIWGESLSKILQKHVLCCATLGFARTMYTESSVATLSKFWDHMKFQSLLKSSLIQELKTDTCGKENSTSSWHSVCDPQTHRYLLAKNDELQNSDIALFMQSKAMCALMNFITSQSEARTGVLEIKAFLPGHSYELPSPCSSVSSDCDSVFCSFFISLHDSIIPIEYSSESPDGIASTDISSSETLLSEEITAIQFGSQNSALFVKQPVGLARFIGFASLSQEYIRIELSLRVKRALDLSPVKRPASQSLENQKGQRIYSSELRSTQQI